jgi:hypothetical protein
MRLYRIHHSPSDGFGKPPSHKEDINQPASICTPAHILSLPSGLPYGPFFKLAMAATMTRAKR